LNLNDDPSFTVVTDASLGSLCSSMSQDNYTIEAVNQINKISLSTKIRAEDLMLDLGNLKVEESSEEEEA
jgi:hypothetical protein